MFGCARNVILRRVDDAAAADALSGSIPTVSQEAMATSLNTSLESAGVEFVVCFILLSTEVIVILVEIDEAEVTSV